MMKYKSFSDVFPVNAQIGVYDPLVSVEDLAYVLNVVPSLVFICMREQRVPYYKDKRGKGYITVFVLAREFEKVIMSLRIKQRGYKNGKELIKDITRNADNWYLDGAGEDVGRRLVADTVPDVRGVSGLFRVVKYNKHYKLQKFEREKLRWEKVEEQKFEQSSYDFLGHIQEKYKLVF